MLFVFPFNQFSNESNFFTTPQTLGVAPSVSHDASEKVTYMSFIYLKHYDFPEAPSLWNVYTRSICTCDTHYWHVLQNKTHRTTHTLCEATSRLRGHSPPRNKEGLYAQWLKVPPWEMGLFFCCWRLYLGQIPNDALLCASLYIKQGKE